MVVKNWSDGDYVYGTNFDEIVSSTVMRFTDTSQRASILVGDLAPQPGMMTYIASSRRWEQYLTISGTGYWTPQPGMLVAVLRQSIQQSYTTSGTDYPVTLDVEDLDILGGHVAGSNNSRYTCVIPGWYEFAGGPTFSGNVSGQRQAKWAKGGTTQPSSAASVGAALTSPMGIAARTMSFNLLAGEYIELIANQTSGGALDSVAGSSATSFSGCMTVKWVGAP